MSSVRSTIGEFLDVRRLRAELAAAQNVLRQTLDELDELRNAIRSANTAGELKRLNDEIKAKELSSQLANERIEKLETQNAQKTQLLNDLDKEFKGVKAEQTLTKKIASEAATKADEAKGLFNSLKGQVDNVFGEIGKLKGSVSKIASDVIESNSFAKKAVGLADDALKGLGNLFTKVAPLLDIAGTLINIASGAFFAYEIYKIWKELGAQKALIEAAKIAGLTAAGLAFSKAVTAALVADKALVASTVATNQVAQVTRDTNLLKNAQQALTTDVAALKTGQEAIRTMNNQQFTLLDNKLTGIGQTINSSTTIINNHTTKEIQTINMVTNTAGGKDYTADLTQIKATQIEHSSALSNLNRQGQTILTQTNEVTLKRIIGESLAPLYGFITGSFAALYNWLNIWVVTPLGALGQSVNRAFTAATEAKTAAQAAQAQATLTNTTLGTPFTTPGSLIAPSLGTLVHPNFASLFSWIIYQMDALLGQWPIKLEIEDSDLIKTGDQTLSLEFPNLSEAVAELLGLAINTKSVTEANLDASMRGLMETGSGRKQAIVNHALLESIQDYLGFSSRQKIIQVPFTYSPVQAVNSNSISAALQPSTQSVKVEENTDMDTLEKQMKALMEAARIIKAVHTRKLNPENVDQWKAMMRASRDQLNKTDPDQEKDDFDLFLEQVETGFTGDTGNDPTKPYDRNYSERPRTRRLNQGETPNV